MADWPTTLPDEFIDDGFSYQPPTNIIRTNMEVGPPKVRRRTTSNKTSFSGTMVMTRDQYNNTFLPFYENNLSDGATAFNMIHPLNNATCSMRIVSYNVSSSTGDYLALQMEMEILP